MKKFLLYFFITFTYSVSYSQTNFWTQTNGPFGGTALDYSLGNNNVVYAATDSGVYKSIDNGITWNSIGLEGQYVRSVSKLSSGTLLAGAARTTNEGSNWIQTDLPQSAVYDIKEINPNIIIAASINGIYKSSNDGSNWAQTLGVDGTSIDTFSNTIYISSYNSGLYKSTDFGNNWVRINSYNQSFTLSVEAGINGYIFATTWNGDIFRSTDAGVTFSDVSAPTMYKTTRCLTTLDGWLYCGTFYTGIWSSSDYGNNWTKQYPGERLGFYVWNLCEGFNGDVYAAVSDKGIVKTNNHGFTWNCFRYRDKYLNVADLINSNDGKIFSTTGHLSTDNALNWTFPDLDFSPSTFSKNILNGFLYATDNTGLNDYYSGVYQSTNNGEVWEFKNINNYRYEISRVYVSRTGNVYAIGFGIFKSTDNGSNWNTISNMYFKALAESSQGHLYGKKRDEGRIYKTTNNGSSWDTVLSFTNNNDCPIFITSSDEIFTGGNNTLFKSTNNGNNWTKLNIIGNVTSIIENQSGRIFVSVYAGGVYSIDGDSVTDITRDIGNRNINSLCFNSLGQLLTGTTTGVYKTNASVISVNNLNQNVPSEYSLFQNYPNPFNPVTVVRYLLIENRFTTLKVYDINGKEVSTLVNQRQNAGSHSVSFDGSNLPSGVYFYILNTNNFTSTKSMVLLK